MGELDGPRIPIIVCGVGQRKAACNAPERLENSLNSHEDNEEESQYVRFANTS